MPSLDIVALDESGMRALQPNDAERATLEVPAGKSLSASVLCQRVEATLGVEVALLRSGEGTVEVEVLDPSSVRPQRFGWTAAPTHVTTAQRTPWEQPGWLRSTDAQIDGALRALGHQRVGPSVQARHWTLSAILRVPTDAGPVWVKAIPPVFAHEPAVLSLVAETGLTTTPMPLAIGDGWWMAKQFPIERPDPVGDPLATLAHVQLALAGQPELNDPSIPRRSLNEIPERLRGIACREDLVAAPSGKALTAAIARIEDIVAAVEATGIPDTVAHGDFHSENTRWSAKGWMLFDWTDSCITHPFVDLALTIRDEGGQWPRRADAYAAPWRRVVGAAAVDRALSAAPVLSAAHEVINYARIADAFPGVAASSMADEVTRWVDRVNAAVTALDRGHPAPSGSRAPTAVESPAPSVPALATGETHTGLCLRQDTPYLG